MSIFGGIGAGVAGLGGLLGAQSSNRAGRQARDWYHARTGEGMDRLYGFLFGQPGLDARSAAGYRIGDTSGANLAGSLFGSGSLTGYNNRTANRGNQMYNRAAGRFGQDADRISGMTGASTLFADNAGQNIDRLGAGAEGMARGYGAGANEVIDAETARALKAANAISQSRLNATGLGNSTLVSNALSGNAVQAGLGAARQKSDIQRQMTELMMGARQGRIGAASASAGRSQQARNVGIDTERALAAARTGLNTGRAGLFMDQRNRNADQLLGAMSGGINNPWLGQSTGQYYPGVSTAGSALGSAGTTLAGLAGSGLFGNPANRNGQIDPRLFPWGS